MSKLNHNLKIIRQIKNRTNSERPFSFTCNNGYSSLWCKGTQLKGNNKTQDYEKNVQLPKVHKNCSNNPFLFSKAPFILWDQFVYIISLYYSYYLILRIYFLPNTSSIKHSFTLKSCFSHTRHRPEPKYRSSPHHPVQLPTFNSLLPPPSRIPLMHQKNNTLPSFITPDPIADNGQRSGYIQYCVLLE